MFEARGLGVALAIFLLLYSSSSLLVSLIWELPAEFIRKYFPQRLAFALFAIRVLPFSLAAVFTFGVTLPSFLLLEPRNSGESVGTAPLLLGIICLLFIVVGVARAAFAHKRTARCVAGWLESASLLPSEGYESGVPVFQTAENSPALTVAGIRYQKVLISESALARLNAAELQGALRHEMAHVHSYDNLKKLLYRLLSFPGMAALERAWSEASEIAADDAAISNRQNALDLASALVKISRLAPVRYAELTTGLLHSSTALTTRVERLCDWSEPEATQSGTVRFYVVSSSIVLLAGIAIVYSQMLVRVHQLTEWLVR